MDLFTSGQFDSGMDPGLGWIQTGTGVAQVIEAGVDTEATEGRTATNRVQFPMPLQMKRARQGIGVPEFEEWRGYGRS